ncbi:MAG: hypothetical protein ACXWUX_03785 [Allosphingosinicella sp.]
MGYFRATTSIGLAGLGLVAVAVALAWTGFGRPTGWPEDEASHVEGYLRAAAEPEPRPVIPAGLTRFDLDCYTSGRLLAAAAPGSAGAVPARPARAWQSTFHLNVDLEARQFCRRACDERPPSHMVAADARRIVFDWRPGHTSWLRRSDGFYYEWLGVGHITAITGRCILAPFTDFPAADEGDSGLTPEPRRAFRSAARRFDMICEQTRLSWPAPPVGNLPNVPAPGPLLHAPYRESVDLESMLACPHGCRAAEPIYSAGPGLIRLRNDRDAYRWLDLESGELYGRTITDGRVEWSVAQCNQGPFTPFPERGRNRG